MPHVHPALRSHTQQPPPHHDSDETLFSNLFAVADLRSDGAVDRITAPFARGHSELGYDRLKRKMPPRIDCAPTTRNLVVEYKQTSSPSTKYNLFPTISVPNDITAKLPPEVPARSLERTRVSVEEQQQAIPDQQARNPPPSRSTDLDQFKISHFPAPPIPLRSKARTTTISAQSFSSSVETPEPVSGSQSSREEQPPGTRASQDMASSRETPDLSHCSSDSSPPQPPTPASSFNRTRTATEVNPQPRPSSRKHALPTLSIRTLFHPTPPLVEAARTQNYPLVLALLAPSPKPLNINAADSTGHNPLHHAVLTSNHPILLALLSRHASQTATTRITHRTPLFLSTHHPNPSITATLLAAGSDPNLASKLDGATPLHKAAQLGHVDTMRLLLAHGADPNRRDVEGMPPLMWATQGKSLPAARLLIQAGANLEARIKLGVNLELSSRQGLTVLHKAVAAGDRLLVGLLLEGGADVDADGPMGVRALHRAAMKGDLGMVLLLLGAGADVGARTEEGWCAVDFAERCGVLAVREVLVEAAAEKGVFNGRGGREEIEGADVNG